MTVAELAAYGHVWMRAVSYGMIDKDTLRACRLGGSYRVKTSDAIPFGRPYVPCFGPPTRMR